MRVIDTRSGQFVDINPKDEDVKYAILSHTWDREGEQTYQELRGIQKRYVTPVTVRQRARWWGWIAQLVALALSSEFAARDWSQFPPTSTSTPEQPSHNVPTTSATEQSESVSIPGTFPSHRPTDMWDDPDLSPKIKEACRIAREAGYDYLWIDSCCIDKTSSSELSESINSMYQWYARARVCYAFLPDVPAEEDCRQWGSRFRESRWFTRGWTLQELIAPRDVRFLSMEWTFIGSKESLADVVVGITKIHYNALLNIEPLDEFSVAQRFSWAAERETTRVEDRAYSPLGIFDINMPTLYGEGEGAFRRLQEEIMRRTPDQSLFAWTEVRTLDCTSPLNGLDVSVRFRLKTDRTPFLAPSCNAYKFCVGIKALSHDEVARRLQLQPRDLPARRYEFTPYGICVRLPVIPFSHFSPPERIDNPTGIPLSKWYLIILGCGHKNFPGHILARLCYIQSLESSTEFLHSGWIDSGSSFDLLPLSPAAITRLRSSGGQISIKTLYIPQPERDQGTADLSISKRHETIKLVLLEKTCETLSAQGYKATLRGPEDDAHPRTHSVALSHDTHTITIDYRHTLEECARQQLTIEADVQMSGPVPQVLHADGPGSTTTSSCRVSWRDYPPWIDELNFKDVGLNVPDGPTALTVRLSLAFARTNHYILLIELETADHPVLAHAPVGEIQDTPDGRGS